MTGALWAASAACGAQGVVPAATASPDKAPAEAATPAEMQTPRRALAAFLDRMAADEKKSAAELLDLSDLTAEGAAATGADLAFRLYQVALRVAPLPPDGDGASSSQAAPATRRPGVLGMVPDAADATSPWSLARLPGARPEASRVALARGAEGGWRFSRETVAQVEKLFAETESLRPLARSGSEAKTTEPWSVWLRDRVAYEPLRRSTFLLANYQWLGLAMLLVVGVCVDRLVRRVLTAAGDFLLRRRDPSFVESTHAVWRPVGWIAHAAAWYAGALALGLPVAAMDVLAVALRLVTVVASVMAALAAIDVVAGVFRRRAKDSGRRFDDLVVPLAASTLKVATGFGGFIAAVAALSNELPSTLLGGLGLGGVALALASQDTLANFFGSLMVLVDRPFEVGDWIVLDGMEGEVETVGFRSTRLRTPTNSQLTIPNQKLASAPLDNLGRRRFRRWKTRLGLEYDTGPDHIAAFCEGVRELIRRHPHTRKDFYLVELSDFGASSLDVELIAFFDVPDYPTEMRERHRLMADILRLAERLGVGFAFPTRTVKLERAGAPPPPAGFSEAPATAGARAAAEIAGELPNYQDRPGPVRFTGPTRLP